MQLVTASQASDSAEGCLLLYKSKARSKVSQQFFLNAMLIQVPCVIVATIDQELAFQFLGVVFWQSYVR